MAERKGTRALELWCKRLIKECPNVKIENMTTSWRNGLAFCALVHHFRPDLIDMSTLKEDNIYENNQLAFTLAEKHLGIPALLDPEDMVANEVPDRLSVLTYLSQFYQRLGHTVTVSKQSEGDNQTSNSPVLPSIGGMKLGKTEMEKCTACSLPVYLAQRLLVANKLYHRRCFRCTKCLGHLDTNNYHMVNQEFVCDNCKNCLSFNVNNKSAQMGMLAFTDQPESSISTVTISPRKNNMRPLSMSEKINMFENKDKPTSFVKTPIDKNIQSLTEINVHNKDVTDNDKSHMNELIIKKEPQITEECTEINTKTPIDKNIKSFTEINVHNKDVTDNDKSHMNEFINKREPQITQECTEIDTEIDKNTTAPKINENTQITFEENQNKEQNTVQEENKYKSDTKIFSFMQTQLSTDKVEDDTEEIDSGVKELEISNTNSKTEQSALSMNSSLHEDSTHNGETTLSETDVSIPPPRRKKHKDKTTENTNLKTEKEYPDHLNPFSDDDDANDVQNDKKESTNPFGSDDDDDECVPVQVTIPPKPNENPQRRVISTNPFWSDDEENSSADESQNSSTYKSSIATSTPNLTKSTPRRKKARAPLPPTITLSEAHASMEDVASISSMSSYNSSYCDQKSIGKLTPRSKKRIAPKPLDSISTFSESSRDMCAPGGSMEKGVDSSGFSSGVWRKKGPAPGLPLPSRRSVRLVLPPLELQEQLERLETQQVGLERQGVMLEQMIRDRCEGDETKIVPQEEVEDLVIQLCELVNEKNDLFRKQTELMYIRRQQRLEQEQADIEHEIRIIQSRPAVNRIDADKIREEELVSRLVEIVKLRDELVQQMDSERRRERQEDIAIANTIASKRAQRLSDASVVSEAPISAAPKKTKVKDKMKKQLKKAKHSLIPKKKDDNNSKGDKSEKERTVK